MDGYPTGAAQRFAKMIEAMTVPSTERGYDPIEQRRGGFEYAFIRGVMDAEPTRDHQEHGDTEFRYTLAVDAKGAAGILVQARGTGPYESTIWSTAYAGPLVPWINNMRVMHIGQIKSYYEKVKQPCPSDEEILEDFPEVVHTYSEEHGWERNQYATKENAAKIAALFAAEAEKYKADNPNKAQAKARAKSWAAA